MSTTARKLVATNKPSPSVIVPRITVRRILVLILSCIFAIFVAIVLMNLQTPRSARSVAEIKAKASPEKPLPATTPVERTGKEPESKTVVKPIDPPSQISSPPVPEMPKPNDTTVPSDDSARTSIGGTVSESDLAYLRAKKLLIPVAGATEKTLHDSFYDTRSEGRIHRALDIMASQGTPVMASADGKVKLHTSARGGIMIYVTDLSEPYVYYYGHLQRYADGMYDSKLVKRGEVIAYVGDTGNAGAGNFHLHFGISKVTACGKWTGGEPINPYPLLTSR